MMRRKAIVKSDLIELNESVRWYRLSLRVSLNHDGENASHDELLLFV